MRISMLSRFAAGAAVLAAAFVVALPCVAQDQQQEIAVGAPIVFFDIAGPDSAAQSSFYSTVFGWSIAPDGAVTVQVSGPVPGTLMGTLRGDPAEKVIYLGVEDVTAALDAVVANGGAIVAPRFEVPGVVVLGLFTDPAGNRMGLVEIKDGVAVVP